MELGYLISRSCKTIIYNWRSSRGRNNRYHKQTWLVRLSARYNVFFLGVWQLDLIANVNIFSVLYKPAKKLLALEISFIWLKIDLTTNLVGKERKQSQQAEICNGMLARRRDLQDCSKPYSIWNTRGGRGENIRGLERSFNLTTRWFLINSVAATWVDLQCDCGQRYSKPSLFVPWKIVRESIKIAFGDHLGWLIGMSFRLATSCAWNFWSQFCDTVELFVEDN